ncbi:MAG TPA: O-antigen ligase family protein [Actinomycetes bacterium]
MSTFLLSVTVALLPLLVPRGPGNTAPADLFAAGFLVLALLALIQRGRRLELPAAPALALILVGSLIALARSQDPKTALLTLLVDVYLLLLLVAIVNHLDRDPGALRTVLVVWTAAALVWATVLIGAHYHVLPRALSELLQVKEGAKRAAGPTGNNPNLAASYLVTSFFVLLASPWPRRRTGRTLAAGWLLLGLFATGSLGGLLGLAAGGALLVAGAYLRGGHTAGEVRALVGAALLAGALAVTGLLLVAGVPRFGLAEVATVSEQAKGGALGGSVGRADKSLTGRLGLWTQAVARTGPQVLTGIGPGQAKTELQISNGSVNRQGELAIHSLHNDYLAFLVERGVLGLAGLLWLYAALARRAGRLSLAGWRWEVWLPALGAGFVATAADAFFHEAFHYRHVVVLFALLFVAGDLVGAERRHIAEERELHAVG